MVGRGAGLLGQIHRLWDLGTFAGLTDAQLLARFADRHEDGAVRAFEALVERHGSMVFRVCRGVLGDEPAEQVGVGLRVQDPDEFPEPSLDGVGPLGHAPLLHTDYWDGGAGRVVPTIFTRESRGAAAGVSKQHNFLDRLGKAR